MCAVLLDMPDTTPLSSQNIMKHNISTSLYYYKGVEKRLGN